MFTQSPIAWSTFFIILVTLGLVGGVGFYLHQQGLLQLPTRFAGQSRHHLPRVSMVNILQNEILNENPDL